ncbi:MAG: hypothetical protein AUG75_23215 [Cyanobacteria bacterium 13_1_20CM_4_61_6]|nr:MAG: hypothetical protein AUG75_23215 [Cyanobacteria bacterium 13_1_20CM_4_61_6]
MRSIEKSSHCVVVAQPEAGYVSNNKIIRNENQTSSKQFQAGPGENFPTFLAASQPDARAQHGSV